MLSFPFTLFSDGAGGGGGYSPGSQSYFSGSGNFIVPAGVTTLKVELWGGGGGGGAGDVGGSSVGGAGGGGGAYIVAPYYAVTPGQSIAYAFGGGTGSGDAVLGTGQGAYGTTANVGGSVFSAGGGTGGYSWGSGGSAAGGNASSGYGGVKTLTNGAAPIPIIVVVTDNVWRIVFELVDAPTSQGSSGKGVVALAHGVLERSLSLCNKMVPDQGAAAPRKVLR